MGNISRSVQGGYVLIATILLGLAISIASSTFLQYVVNASSQLTEETYTTLAEEAAEAGAVYAANCIGNYTANWSALRPNTSCDGATQGQLYVATSTIGNYTLRSSFSVDPYAETPDNYKLTVHGTLEILRGTASIRTYSTIKTSLISKKVLLAATSQQSAQQVTAISLDTHACAIANGKLYCWGANDKGQLGDGTTVAKNTPTQVTTSGFSTKIVTKVAVGFKDTCAIADGLLYCWGDNSYGQVGNNSVTASFSSPVAVTIPGGTTGRFTDLSLSQSTNTPGSACGIIDGSAFCWGRNDTQQLGLSSSSTKDVTLRRVPTAVYTGGVLSGLKLNKISIGGSSACGIAIGYLVCWGGQSSTASPPTQQPNPYPNPFNFLVNNVSVTGNTICSTVTFYKTLVCHGQSNALPALNTSQPWTSPWIATYGAGYFQGAHDMDSGTDFSVTPTNDSLYCAMVLAFPLCAGTANTGSATAGTPFKILDSPELNILGNPSYGYPHLPTTIGAGNNYGCLVADGSLFCWGKDTNGTLANGVASGTVYSIPTRVAQGIIGAQVDKTTPSSLDTNDFAYNFTADGPISLGASHACALVNAYVTCWGKNSSGQLGAGNTVDNYQPATSAVVLQTLADKVSAGGDHTCATSGGKLFCWGDNTNGELGADPSTVTKYIKPVELSYFTSNNYAVSDVSVGASNVCAIASGYVFCWGKNDNKQVGSSSVTALKVWTPTMVQGLPGNAIAVSVGATHACAIVNSGETYCWGTNTSYELGNTTAGSQYPVKVTATGAFTGITAGKNFTCGILNGVVNCWGDNTSGQLAISLATTKRAAPASVGSTLLATSVSAGDSHVCAVLQGATYCWGKNDVNQVSSSGTTPILTPTLVNTGDMAPQAKNNNIAPVSIGVGAGGSTTCSVANGLIMCWGNNSNQQAGSQTDSSGSPTKVTTPLTTQWYRYEMNKNKGIFY